MSLFEVNIPYRLVAGDATELDFASDDPGLVIESVVSTADVRQAVDDRPLQDGSIIHPAFRSGRLTTISGRITAEDGFDNRRSGLEDLNTMLMKFLRLDGRLYWTPTGYGDERMLLNCRLSQALSVSEHPQLGPSAKQWSFQLASPDPAIYDSTQQTTTIAGFDSATITNAGNGPGWVTAKVYSGDFVLSNNTLGLAVHLGVAAIGGGDYIELQMFRETAYQNGDGANWLGKLFCLSSDFWPLVPGDNEISFDGSGSVDIIWNSSWA